VTVALYVLVVVASVASLYGWVKYDGRAMRVSAATLATLVLLYVTQAAGRVAAGETLHAVLLLFMAGVIGWFARRDWRAAARYDTYTDEDTATVRTEGL
jgi:hypothetical protein